MADAAASLRIGLPAWAYAPWRGPYFPPDRVALDAYADVFDTVEGNSTFYALPDAPTVARWRDVLRGRDLRICFKLPRQVTHGGLARERVLLDSLFARLEPLADQLGPFMIQLPPRLGPAAAGELEALLRLLPRAHRFAIEVRHPDWFAEPAALHDLQDRFGLGRVLLDARPIHGAAPAHPDIADAVHEKPDLPVAWDGPETLRVVRFVAHPLASYNDGFMAEWAGHLAHWLRPGRAAHVMVHCPNDAHCPPLARRMVEALRVRMPSLRALPPWPVAQLGLDL